MNVLTRCFVVAVLLAAAMSCGVRAEDKSATARIDSLCEDIRVEGNNAVRHVFTRTTILTTAGSEFADTYAYESRYISCNSLSARVLDSQGHLVYKRTKKDMTKICGYGESFQLYSDECRYMLELTSPRVPFTTEVESESACKSLWVLTGVSLEEDIPITCAVIRLSFPEDRPIRYKLYGSSVPPSEEVSGGRRTLTWIFRDLPARRDLEYRPPQFVEGTRLELAAEKLELDDYAFSGLNWKNIGVFYRRLSADNDASVTSQIAPPSDNAETRKLADSLYRNVTQSTRYVSVSIGIGGWKPHPLAQIRKWSYGDCKDLSALLIADLKSHGITAYPCLLLTSDQGSTDSTFACDNFNHVITMALIGTDTLWYDPTCSLCPPGELPAPDEGTTVLVTTDTGGILVTTPWSKPVSNRFLRKTDITLDAVGHFVAEVELVASGKFATRFRNAVAHLDQKELDEYAREWLLGSKPTLTVVNYRIGGRSDIGAPLVINYTLKSTRPLERMGQTQYFLPFLFSSRNPYADAKLATRNMPVWLGYPWEGIDSVTIHGVIMQRGYSVATPEDTTMSFPWLTMTADYSKSDSSVSACLTVTYKEPQVPVADFERFRTYLNERKLLLDRPVKFSAP